MKTIKIAGFCGSLRKDSYNKKVLNVATSLAPESMEIIDVPFDALPLYNQDLDTETPPAAVSAFLNTLDTVDGLLIVSPEYNYSIPGGLKNALDWASRGKNNPLLGKPVSLMGATPGMWGTVRMQAAFLNFFRLFDMKLVMKPEVLINAVQTKFDEHGNLTDDFTKQVIQQNLENLKLLIEK
ncbi:MAG: NAD(P)H-dependent oxidoreductase [Candidatus Symbiothrix sp.]|jgi:chromate reductase|nr:NAD(P)H-dependent oxidoreductase [Candidatus Symbiothrix sp.]